MRLLKGLPNIPKKGCYNGGIKGTKVINHHLRIAILAYWGNIVNTF